MKLVKSFILAFIAMAATTNIAWSQNAIPQTTDSTMTLIIKVKGADCSEDLKTIATNVEKLDGVSNCKIIKEGVTSSFEVKCNPAVVTKKEIYAAIENTSGCDNPNDKPYKVKNKMQ
jgi:copper chaperone CopZ